MELHIQDTDPETMSKEDRIAVLQVAQELFEYELVQAASDFVDERRLGADGATQTDLAGVLGAIAGAAKLAETLALAAAEV